MNDVRPAPAPVSADIADPDWDHIFCYCNMDIAFCGEDVSGLEVIDWDTEGQTCPMCEIVERVGGGRCPSCKARAA